MRQLKWVNLALLSALIAFAVWAWPQLPERIPTHFGASGVPDAWSRRTPGTWFMLPGIAVFTMLVLYASAAAILRWPASLNIPSKQQFLALPREDQQPILEFCADCIHLIGTLMLLLFCTIQYATWRAALGGSTRALMITVLVLALGGSLALTVVLVAKTSSMVNDAYRRARARGTVQTPTS